MHLLCVLPEIPLESLRRFAPDSVRLRRATAGAVRTIAPAHQVSPPREALHRGPPCPTPPPPALRSSLRSQGSSICTSSNWIDLRPSAILKRVAGRAESLPGAWFFNLIMPLALGVQWTEGQRQSLPTDSGVQMRRTILPLGRDLARTRRRGMREARTRWARKAAGDLLSTVLRASG